MSEDYLKERTSQDFDKAKGMALFSNILSILKPEKRELLSFSTIKELIKPKGQSYLGMKAVKVSDIRGSEDRYRDFNNTFLPKKGHLKGRWMNVDMAYHKDIILPPIKLFKIGEIYFVRDGNHRVSVARTQGVHAIDAEVIELTSEIDVTKDSTLREIRNKVIAYEKNNILKTTGLDSLDCFNDIVFTAPGRFEELLKHIYGHKYYINMEQTEEISLLDAADSWYKNLYDPICRIIDGESILKKFPGRTHADLYIWIVTHWYLVKEKYGQEYPLDKAAKEYTKEFGKKGIFED